MIYFKLVMTELLLGGIFSAIGKATEKEHHWTLAIGGALFLAVPVTLLVWVWSL